MYFLKLFIVLCIITQAGIVNAGYKIDFTSMDEELTYLYVDKVDMIKNVDTMTYLYNVDTKMKNNMMDYFYYFSESIGKKNGATVIPNISLLNKLQKEQNDGSFKFNFDDIFSIIENSNCNFPSDDAIYAIYEDMKSKECIYLHIDPSSNIIPTLSDITNLIKGKSSMSKIQFKRDFENTINGLFGYKNGLHGIKNQLRKLIDTLFENYDVTR